MEKEDVVHIYNGILFTHKKNKIMAFVATWIDLEIFIPSEVSQAKRYTLALIQIHPSSFYVIF